MRRNTKTHNSYISEKKNLEIRETEKNAIQNDKGDARKKNTHKCQKNNNEYGTKYITDEKYNNRQSGTQAGRKKKRKDKALWKEHEGKQENKKKKQTPTRRNKQYRKLYLEMRYNLKTEYSGRWKNGMKTQ